MLHWFKRKPAAEVTAPARTQKQVLEDRVCAYVQSAMSKASAEANEMLREAHVQATREIREQLLAEGINVTFV